VYPSCCYAEWGVASMRFTTKGGARVSNDNSIEGAAILDQVAAQGIAHIVSVPDITTSAGLLWPIVTDKRFRLIRVCKEDEGVSICAALSFCDKRALLLIQYTVLLDSVNALRAAGCEYKLPVCMMIGLLEKEPNVPPTQSARFGVRIVEPILDTMGIPHALMELAGEERHVAPAIQQAYRDSWPTALLIGRRI
jgi:sulfopyruvate decarboxylase subunit alpha